MSKVVKFIDYRNKNSADGIPVIQKIVDGRIVECVNFDILTSAQYLLLQRHQRVVSRIDRDARHNLDLD